MVDLLHVKKRKSSKDHLIDAKYPVCRPGHRVFRTTAQDLSAAAELGRNSVL
jgi:hypothetical protein